MRHFTILTAALLVVFVAGCAPADDPAPPPAPPAAEETGPPAETFAATSLAGDRIDLDDYLGEQPVLLNFFTSW